MIYYTNNHGQPCSFWPWGGGGWCCQSAGSSAHQQRRRELRARHSLHGCFQVKQLCTIIMFHNSSIATIRSRSYDDIFNVCFVRTKNLLHPACLNIHICTYRFNIALSHGQHESYASWPCLYLVKYDKTINQSRKAPNTSNSRFMPPCRGCDRRECISERVRDEVSYQLTTWSSDHLINRSTDHVISL